MARRDVNKAVEEETDLNLTPMLDVVFILLIFFIVTAVFVKEPRVEIARPLVSEDLQEKRNPTILVAVTGEDEVWIAGQPYDLGKVRVEIEKLRAENPRGEVVIQGDDEAPFGTVLEVQDIIQRLNIPVYISTEQKE